MKKKRSMKKVVKGKESYSYGLEISFQIRDLSKQNYLYSQN